MTSWRYTWLQVALFYVAASAHADGALVLRERTLLQEGPRERGYCDAAGTGSEVECQRVMAKVLSGYSYARGHVLGGLAVDPEAGFDQPVGLATLHVSAISAALPGGELAVGTLDGVLGNVGTRRLRLTLVEAQDLFFCSDAQSGALRAPLFGMFSYACRPTALAALDVSLATLQWDVATKRMMVEWVHLGPALELLGNGFAYAHVLRSLTLGLPLDVRTLQGGTARPGGGTSLGASLRLFALYRSRQWETRIALRERTALLGGAGPLRDNTLEGELRLSMVSS